MSVARRPVVGRERAGVSMLVVFILTSLMPAFPGPCAKQVRR